MKTSDIWKWFQDHPEADVCFTTSDGSIFPSLMSAGDYAHDILEQTDYPACEEWHRGGDEFNTEAPQELANYIVATGIYKPKKNFMKNIWYWLLWLVFHNVWQERCEHKTQYNFLLGFILFVIAWITFAYIYVFTHKL